MTASRIQAQSTGTIIDELAEATGESMVLEFA